MPAVSFQNVSYRYSPGAPPALEGVSIDVHEGELLAIVGPNGGGKSTLLKLMLGLLSGYEGAVSVMGLSPAEARRRSLVGWVPQKSEAAPRFPVSAREVVEMGASWRVSGWRSVSPEIRASVDRALEVVGAAEFADRPAGRLSGGQLQRVLIARALASGARVLALDEPTVGIDAVGQRQFGALIRKLHKDLGMTILLVSHDLGKIAGGAGTCDRVACLRRRLHFHDAPRGVTPQILAQVFEHDLADIFGAVHVDAHKAAECDGGPDHHHHHPPHPDHPHAPTSAVPPSPTDSEPRP